MSRDKEITQAAKRFCGPYEDEKLFQRGAKWADKTMVEKVCEYAQSKYDLDYCGDVKDILNYLKSLVEE